MIGSRLRQFRQAKGLTLDELAEASRVSRGTIHRIELNQVSPRLDTLMDLCTALGTDLGEFFQLDYKAAGDANSTENVKKDSGFRLGARTWLEHVEALIHLSADSLSVLDSKGMVVYESDSALHFFAAPPDERRARPWWTSAHPDDQARLKGEFEAFLETGENGTLSLCRMAHRDGTWHWVRTALSRQLDHPLLHGIIASTQDVTLVKKVEEDLQRSQKNECLSLALGGVTHTFSNLLMGLQAHLEFALGKEAANSTAAVHLTAMQNAMQAATQLLSQMRDYAGNPLLVLESLDLNALIRSLEPTFVERSKGDLAFHFELADDIPAIKADRRLIERLLVDLVVNACDAHAGRPGAIIIRTAHAARESAHPCDRPWVEGGPEGLEEAVLLEVRDSGCGMSPELLAKIFDPFFSTKFKGLGMGLSTVRGIVRSHRAALRVDSEPNYGSRFQVFLPLDPYQQPLLPDREYPKNSAAEAILIAEDDDLLRGCIRGMLEFLGHREIIEATNGEQALHLFQAHRKQIRLVVLDLDMPIMGGIEAFTKLRSLDPALKVLFSTGAWEHDPSFATRLSEGSTGVLRKPYRIEELRTALLALI